MSNENQTMDFWNVFSNKRRLKKVLGSKTKPEVEALQIKFNEVVYELEHDWIVAEEKRKEEEARLNETLELIESQDVDLEVLIERLRKSKKVRT